MESDDVGKSLLRPHFRLPVAAHNLAFNERVKTMKAAGQTVHHFGFGQSPFSPPDFMVNSLMAHAKSNAYLDIAGIPELRTAIVKFHKHFDSLTLNSDDVLVAPGSKELIFLLLNVFDGAVLLANPTWPTYKPQAELAGHQPYIVTSSFEERWQITAANLEKTITENHLESSNKLLILCSPDNPTGSDYSEDDLKELSDVLRKHKVIVISDEIYSRLHYDQKHKSLVQFYPEGTILSSGFSKWASAGGWRMGYHIYPSELYALRDAVRCTASHTYSCAPAPMQYALAHALQDLQACDDYIAHTARIMKAVGLYCYSELTSIGVQCVAPTAGYYCFPNFEAWRDVFRRRGITTGAQMCDAMLSECRVAFLPGGPAFLRPADEFTVRCCFVDFDGDEALTFSRTLGLTSELPADFVQRFAASVYQGIQDLKAWLLKQKAESS